MNTSSMGGFFITGERHDFRCLEEIRSLLYERHIPEEEQLVSQQVEIELKTFGRLENNKLREVSQLPEALIDHCLNGGRREIPVFFHLPIQRHVLKRQKGDKKADKHLKLLTNIIKMYRKIFVGIWETADLMNGGGPLDSKSQDVAAFPGKLHAIIPTIDAATWIQTHYEFHKSSSLKYLDELELTWPPPFMNEESRIVNLGTATFDEYSFFTNSEFGFGSSNSLDCEQQEKETPAANKVPPPTSPPTAAEAAHPTRGDQDSQETEVAHQGITTRELEFANENDINVAELKRVGTAFLRDICKIFGKKEAVAANSFPPTAAGSGGGGAGPYDGPSSEPGQDQVVNCLPWQGIATFVLDLFGPIQTQQHLAAAAAAAAAGVAASASSHSGDDSLLASDQDRKPPYDPNLTHRARYEQKQQLQQRNYGIFTPPHLQTRLPEASPSLSPSGDAGFGSHANNSAGAHNGRRHPYDYMPAPSNRGYDVPAHATAFRHQPRYRIIEPHDEHTQEGIQRSYSDSASRAVGYKSKRNHYGSTIEMPYGTHNEHSYHDHPPSNYHGYERNSGPPPF